MTFVVSEQLLELSLLGMYEHRLRKQDAGVLIVNEEGM